MSRVLRAFLPLSLAGFVATCSCDAERPRPEHVVLIVIDTLRADRTTPYGYARDTSPTLARLAREGVLFENAVAQSSWTSPSMVSMMTGRYLAGERLTVPDEAKTLAEAFEHAGFQTAAFICNDILSTKTRFDRGFQVFEQLEPYSDDGKIVQWLESSKGKRTFTWIHLAEPHDDPKPGEPTQYGPPTAEHVRFEKDPAELPRDHVAFLEAFAKSHALADPDADIATIRRERAGYDDDVAYADRRVQRYVEALERAGIYGDTAIVIAADHGEGLWTREAYDTGYRKKEIGEKHQTPTLLNLLMATHGSQVARELVHVPLIVKAPGLGPNVVVKSWVENVDIAPTLFELTDVPSQSALQGKSLVPLAESPSSDPKRKVFSLTRFATSVIDEHGMQLILPSDDGACKLGLEPELYDLRADPEARNNLAAARPELVAELRGFAVEHSKIGLPGEQIALTDENKATFAALGYLDNGIVDESPDLSRMPTPELIAALANTAVPCLGRLNAARALAGRTFTDEERAKLVECAAKTDEVAVRGALEKALGP
jgi:arylsulfatase A-like enzyme